MRHGFRRIGVPVALIGTAIYLSVGCIPLPGSFKRPDGLPRPESKIGGRTSDKPIRLHESTLNDAISEFGVGPLRVSKDRRSATLRPYTVETGYLVWPFCPSFGETTTEARYLNLKFDESGRLRSFKVDKMPLVTERDSNE